MDKKEVAMHVRFIPLIVVAALALAALPVAAHHGWAGNGEEAAPGSAWRVIQLAVWHGR